MQGGGAVTVPFPSLGAFKLRVTVDFTLAAWNTIGTHRVFTRSGLARTVIFYFVTGSLTSAGAATVAFGVTGATADYAAAQAYTNLVVDWMVNPGGTRTQSPTTGSFLFSTTKADDIFYESVPYPGSGFEIAAAALTGGTIEAYCFWTPLSDGATVVAAAGGAL